MTENDKNIVLNSAVNGIITTGQITALGIHRSVLSELVINGDLIHVSRGVYMLPDEWEDEFFLFQQKYKRSILSHATALYLHGYSERVPLRLHATFPSNYNSPSLQDENADITRVIKENYGLGLCSVQTPSGNTVTAYDVERSLCDVLRGSGDDIQVIHYAMKKYASSKQRDINKLMRYARQLRVEPKVRKYIEVLL